MRGITSATSSGSTLSTASIDAENSDDPALQQTI